MAALQGHYPAEIEAINTAWMDLAQEASIFFDKAIEVINNFKTKKDQEPYSYLHYDDYVARTAAHFGLGATDDPVVNGTHYCDFFKGMPRSFASLARAIVKNAPKKD